MPEPPSGSYLLTANNSSITQRERKCIPFLLFGCVSFFCTNLCCSTRSGRRTAEKRFAPGVARARTTRRWLLEGLSRRSAGSSNRWVRQPMHPYSPHDEEPQGPLQPLLAFRLPTGGAQRLPMSHRCCPGLVPLSIAHGVAQHEHGVDVLPTPAHASAFEACFDDQLVRTLHAA